LPEEASVTTSTIRTIDLTLTKSDFPAIWESGGHNGTLGSATIVAKSDGSKPHATFVRKDDSARCGDQALICLHKGFYLLSAIADEDKKVAWITIERVVQIKIFELDGKKNATADLEVVSEYSAKVGWNVPIEQFLKGAIDAADTKAVTSNCQEAAYINVSERKPNLNGSAAKRQQRQPYKGPRPSVTPTTTQSNIDSTEEIAQSLGAALATLMELKRTHGQSDKISLELRLKLGDVWTKAFWELTEDVSSAKDWLADTERFLTEFNAAVAAANSSDETTVASEDGNIIDFAAALQRLAELGVGALAEAS
jgi:hypothetical protein